MKTETIHPGDMLVVVGVNRQTGALTLQRYGSDGPQVELVRIQSADGAVAYLSREEYEGRRDGTWQTFDLMGNEIPLKPDRGIALDMIRARASELGKSDEVETLIAKQNEILAEIDRAERELPTLVSSPRSSG